MKKNYLFLSAFILAGCAPSVIKVDVVKDEEPYPMFGKVPSRNFYLPQAVGDSLRLKWESEINGSFQNSSVTVYDKFVFLNDLSGRVFCFNLETGKVAGQLKHKGAVYTTPLINKFIVIYAVAFADENRSLLVIYDFNNGKFITEKEIEGRVLSEMIKTEDGFIFTTEKGKIYRFNFSGENIWETDTKTFTHSSPALFNNVLIFGNDKGEVTGINIEDGNVLYKKKISGPVFSGVSVDDGKAYLGSDDGSLYVINSKDGNVLWSFDSGARIVMTPVVYEDRIIIGNLSGNLFSLEKENGKIIWETKINGVLNSSPLVTKNIIFISNLYEKYHLVDPENGKVMKTIELEGRGKLSPVFSKNILFIGYDSGILRAYELFN